MELTTAPQGQGAQVDVLIHCRSFPMGHAGKKGNTSVLAAVSLATSVLLSDVLFSESQWSAPASR